MSEMVERAAKAIFVSEGWPEKNWETIPEHGDGRQAYRDKARAAIEAMREPTKTMCDEPTWYDGDQSFTPGDAEEVWHQMLDAALK